MGYHTFRFDRPQDLIFEDFGPGQVERAYVAQDSSIRLRSVSEDGTRYALDGKFQACDVILPNWSPKALTGLYCFAPLISSIGGWRLPWVPDFGLNVRAPGAVVADPVATGFGFGLSPTGADPSRPGDPDSGYVSNKYGYIPDIGAGGEVRFRISVDGGTTWLFWNGAAWVTATGSNYNTPLEVDTGFESLPFSKLNPQLRILARLIPSSDGRKSPILHNVVVYCDFVYDLHRDIMVSMKRYLEKVFRIQTVWENLDFQGTEFTVEHYWEVLLEPVEVYNLTSDPDGTTNLFSRFTADGRGLVLSSPQSGHLQARLFVRPKVFITAEDFFQLSTSPAVVVFIPTTTEDRNLRLGCDSVCFHYGKLEGRKEYARTFHDANCRITVQSPRHHEVDAMTSELQRVLTQYRDMTSIALDELFPIVSATPVTDGNVIGTGLFRKDFSCIVVAKGFLRPDAQVTSPLVTEVHVNVVGMGKTKEQVFVEDP